MVFKRGKRKLALDGSSNGKQKRKYSTGENSVDAKTVDQNVAEQEDSCDTESNMTESQQTTDMNESQKTEDMDQNEAMETEGNAGSLSEDPPVQKKDEAAAQELSQDGGETPTVSKTTDAPQDGSTEGLTASGKTSEEPAPEAPQSQKKDQDVKKPDETVQSEEKGYDKKPNETLQLEEKDQDVKKPNETLQSKEKDQDDKKPDETLPGENTDKVKKQTTTEEESTKEIQSSDKKKVTTESAENVEQVTPKDQHKDNATGGEKGDEKYKPSKPTVDQDDQNQTTETSNDDASKEKTVDDDTPKEDVIMTEEVVNLENNEAKKNTTELPEAPSTKEEKGAVELENIIETKKDVPEVAKNQEETLNLKKMNETSKEASVSSETPTVKVNQNQAEMKTGKESEEDTPQEVEKKQNISENPADQVNKADDTSANDKIDTITQAKQAEPAKPCPVEILASGGGDLKLIENEPASEDQVSKTKAASEDQVSKTKPASEDQVSKTQLPEPNQAGDFQDVHCKILASVEPGAKMEVDTPQEAGATPELKDGPKQEGKPASKDDLPDCKDMVGDMFDMPGSQGAAERMKQGDACSGNCASSRKENE